MVSNATDPTTTILMRNKPLTCPSFVNFLVFRGEKKSENHQGHEGSRRKPAHSYLARAFMYFPRINFNFFRLDAEFVLGSVRMACASAPPNLHIRPFGI